MRPNHFHSLRKKKFVWREFFHSETRACICTVNERRWKLEILNCKLQKSRNCTQYRDGIFAEYLCIVYLGIAINNVCLCVSVCVGGLISAFYMYVCMVELH
jgi:hypothetical protein